MAFIFSIARRYLFATDADGRAALIPYIGVLSVALGVIVLIVVNAIYAGYSDTIQRRLLATSGHLLLQDHGAPIDDWQNVASEVESIVDERTAISVFPVLSRQVLLRQTQTNTEQNGSGCDLSDPLTALFCDVSVPDNQPAADSVSSTGKDQAAQLWAYSPAALEAKFNFPPPVLEAFERGELVLGRRLAQSLDVRVGDQLRVVAPPFDPNSPEPEQRAALSVTLPIGALADFGLYVADAGWAVLDFQTAQRVFKAGFGSDTLELFVDELHLVDTIGAEIQAALWPQMRVINMKNQVAQATAYIRQEQQLIALVVGMTLLVASVGIVSGLVMLVYDKRREIAVLRTMGARQRDILLVFMLAGGGIGLIGVIVGVGLGVLIAANANEIRLLLEAGFGVELFPVKHFNITTLPSKLEWSTVIYTSVFAVSLTLVASLYPAWQASRTDPALGVKGG